MSKSRDSKSRCRCRISREFRCSSDKIALRSGWLQSFGGTCRFESVQSCGDNGTIEPLKSASSLPLFRLKLMRCSFVGFQTLLCLLGVGGLAVAQEPATNAPAVSVSETETPRSPRIVELPGMKIHVKQRIVDLEAVICLDHGPLELVACGRGTKEHESIVALSSRAMHIHTALLLIGAVNGHPAMRRQKPGEETVWESVPPKGDVVEVWMAIPDASGKITEHPISEFVVRTQERVDEVEGRTLNSPQDQVRLVKGEVESLPNRFLFAGSQLRDAQAGPRQYLADLSGDYISIATFGDELLCLPFVESKANDVLSWQIKPKSLPKVGTKVTLRLKFKKKSQEPESFVDQG